MIREKEVKLLKMKIVIILKKLKEKKKLEFLKPIQLDYYMKEISMFFWPLLLKKQFHLDFNIQIYWLICL